jgi:trimethylamine:corrinoid methyltransferase-like protein
MELIASIPERFTLHARHPAKSVEVGEEATVFVPMTGTPFIRGLEDERRCGTIADLANFHKLAHEMPALHSTGTSWPQSVWSQPRILPFLGETTWKAAPACSSAFLGAISSDCSKPSVARMAMSDALPGTEENCESFGGSGKLRRACGRSRRSPDPRASVPVRHPSVRRAGARWYGS